jgi:aconitase A
MRRSTLAWTGLVLALTSVLFVSATALAASTEADFRSAYAAADAAEKQAVALRNQWPPTESALADARTAAEQGDFDRAAAAAKEAEALAKASIFQAESEKEAWKALEIR